MWRRAIDPANGAIFEETFRCPPTLYALFHLWPMHLSSHLIEVHYDNDEDLWNYVTADGGTIESAFDRYADILLGNTAKPTVDGCTNPDNITFYPWLYELAYQHWPKTKYRDVLLQGGRNTWALQTVGPVELVLGATLP